MRTLAQTVTTSETISGSTPNYQARCGLIRAHLLDPITRLYAPPVRMQDKPDLQRAFMAEMTDACVRELPDRSEAELQHLLAEAKRQLVGTYTRGGWPVPGVVAEVVRNAARGRREQTAERLRAPSQGARIARLRRHVEGMERRKRQYGEMWHTHEERQLQHTRSLLAEALGEPPLVGDLPPPPAEPEDRFNMPPVSLADATDFFRRVSLHRDPGLRTKSSNLVRSMLKRRGVDLGNGRVSHDVAEIWEAATPTDQAEGGQGRWAM